MNLAPIVLFVYNRPRHLQNTIEALKKNELAAKSELFVYSDGPKNDDDERIVNEVRQILYTIDGFIHVRIIEQKSNKGLANSVIYGVSDVLKHYSRAIVVEDDIVCSKLFLSYMNQALHHYEKKDDIFSVTGFNFPSRIMKIPKTYKYDVYLSYRSLSWGWGTWADRWKRVDWEVSDFQNFFKDNNSRKRFNRGGEDLSHMLRSQMKGKLDSWDIIWCYAHYKNNAFCVHPTKSLVSNIGLDGSGTHCRPSNKTLLPEMLDHDWKPNRFVDDLAVNSKIAKSYKKIHRVGFLNKMILSLKYRFADLTKQLMRLPS